MTGLSLAMSDAEIALAERIAAHLDRGPHGLAAAVAAWWSADDRTERVANAVLGNTEQPRDIRVDWWDTIHQKGGSAW